MTHWRTEQLGHNTDIFDTEGQAIAEVWGGRILEEGKANARLIAAAPVLLNALRRLLNDSQYKDHPEASQMAINAIVAATGKHP